jgi:hypothetical protein
VAFASFSPTTISMFAAASMLAAATATPMPVFIPERPDAARQHCCHHDTKYPIQKWPNSYSRSLVRPRVIGYANKTGFFIYLHFSSPSFELPFSTAIHLEQVYLTT